MRRSLKILSIVVLVIIVVAGILITHFALSSPYTAMQNKAIGSNVTVSGSKVPTSVKATIDQTAQLSFSSMQPLGPVFQVTPAGTLPAPITLRFKLSQQATTGGLVLIASRETQNGSWTLEQSTVSADGWYASVQTTHLSWWQPLWYDLKAAATIFRQEVLDGLTGDMTTEAENPHCDNESQARQGDYTITSSAKNTLYWCFGVEGGQRVLKVVNRVRYPLEVSHPGFIAMPGGLPPFELDQLARLDAGQDSILYPFEEAEYTVNLTPGTKAFIATQFSGVAQSLYQLQVGVTTAINFLTRFGAGVGIVADGAITVTKFDAIVKFVDDTFLTPIKCLNAVRTWNVGNIIAGCFSANDMMEAFGWKGLLLAPLMVVGSLMEFFRSSLDSITGIINGDDRYQILVSRFDSMAVFDSYVGTWHVHGYDLTIKSDRTGQDIWHDGFSPSGDWCNGNDSITFTVMPDGSLVGIVENSWYTPANDGCLPGDWQQGDQFTLVRQGDHLLYQTWKPPVPDANYLCDTYAVGQGWGQCGA